MQGTIQILESSNLYGLINSFHFHKAVPLVAEGFVEVNGAIQKLSLLQAFLDDCLVYDVVLVELVDHRLGWLANEKVVSSKLGHRWFLRRYFPLIRRGGSC